MQPHNLPTVNWWGTSKMSSAMWFPYKAIHDLQLLALKSAAA